MPGYQTWWSLERIAPRPRPDEVTKNQLEIVYNRPGPMSKKEKSFVAVVKGSRMISLKTHNLHRQRSEPQLIVGNSKGEVIIAPLTRTVVKQTAIANGYVTHIAPHWIMDLITQNPLVRLFNTREDAQEVGQNIKGIWMWPLIIIDEIYERANNKGILKGEPLMYGTDFTAGIPAQMAWHLFGTNTREWKTKKQDMPEKWEKLYFRNEALLPFAVIWIIVKEEHRKEDKKAPSYQLFEGLCTTGRRSGLWNVEVWETLPIETLAIDHNTINPWGDNPIREVVGGASWEEDTLPPIPGLSTAKESAASSSSSGATPYPNLKAHFETSRATWRTDTQTFAKEMSDWLRQERKRSEQIRPAISYEPEETECELAEDSD